MIENFKNEMVLVADVLLKQYNLYEWGSDTDSDAYSTSREYYIDLFETEIKKRNLTPIKSLLDDVINKGAIVQYIDAQFKGHRIKSDANGFMTDDGIKYPDTGPWFEFKDKHSAYHVINLWICHSVLALRDHVNDFNQIIMGYGVFPYVNQILTSTLSALKNE